MTPVLAVRYCAGVSANPLISVAQLRQRLARLGHAPLLLDVRWQLGRDDGRADYLRGHLPGAVFVDLDRDLAGPARPGRSGGRHPMPQLEDFELAMARCGVDNHRAVVCYDDVASLAAARCWWLLRHLGKDKVFVLDGGLSAWTAAGLPLDAGETSIDEGDFEVRPGRADVLDADDVLHFVRDGVLIDARPADRFRGENETIDPVAGHIPGARSIPARSLLDSGGSFLDAQALRERFSSAGIAAHTPVATYCGSGVQASHVALGLAAAGLHQNVPVYIGSWSDWITDPRRPIAVGE